MGKFEYKKWIIENKYGKGLLLEQTGSATGSATGSNDPDCYACVNGSVQTLPSSQLYFPTPGDPTLCGFHPTQLGGGMDQYYITQAGLNAASGSCGGTNPPTGNSGCANISYSGECFDGPNATVYNDGCSTIDGQMPNQSHVGTYVERPGSTNVWKVTAIGAQNTTNNGNAYTSTTCGGGNSGIQYPGNFNPQTWWNTFITAAQSKPWYATKKCNFFQSRINKWATKLQSGVGPKYQNMLSSKISQTASEALAEGCTFPGL